MSITRGVRNLPSQRLWPAHDKVLGNDWNWNLEMLVFLRIGENRSTRMRKTSRSKDKNQQQTQPTYDAESGNRTQATLVGDECFHHCVSAASPRHICSSCSSRVIMHLKITVVQLNTNLKSFEYSITLSPSLMQILPPCLKVCFNSSGSSSGSNSSPTFSNKT